MDILFSLASVEPVSFQGEFFVEGGDKISLVVEEGVPVGEHIVYPVLYSKHMFGDKGYSCLRVC